jgi:hypothetical protein
MNKSSKLLININSTGSYTRDMVLKCITEPSHELHMFHKKFSSIIFIRIINEAFNSI